MADKTVRNGFDNGAIQRYVDMGDGTFAEKVFFTPIASSGSDLIARARSDAGAGEKYINKGDGSFAMRLS